MNIYSRKRSWKALLLIVASAIVVASLWYTNGFIRKLAENERNQVELWAKAISRKANLVNETEALFQNLREKEKSYVYLWTEATKKLISAENDEDIEFYTNVITGNKDIPVLVTNEDGLITQHKNLNQRYRKYTNLHISNYKKFTHYPPIKFNYYGDQYQYLYFRNSKTYYDLKNTLEDFTTSFLDEIVNNNLSTPVIITDSTFCNVVAFGGSIDSTAIKDSVSLANSIARMKESRTPIVVNLPNKGKNYIFYEESPVLQQMRIFPAVLLSIIGLFLILSYILFSISRKSEQSKVWAGMAKETAHQLGTPISSLIGWIEMMKLNYPNETGFDEMNKDINRLTQVSERFSKIGSIPELSENNLASIISNVVDYMRIRTPKKIELIFSSQSEEPIISNVNKQLIVWVFENLIRNSVDAIGSKEGKIIISLIKNDKNTTIDIIDNGKGIPKSKQKNVFKPGFSTKSRGWGLGLSLSKRIIEDYHKGKIIVKNSSIGQGTTFRITLK